MEVPGPEQLGTLPVEVIRDSEPWITTLRATASDDASVEFTWDAIAKSVVLRWVGNSGEECLRIERECVAKISLQERDTRLFLEAVTSGGALAGSLTVAVGETVTVRDVLLQR